MAMSSTQRRQLSQVGDRMRKMAQEMNALCDRRATPSVAQKPAPGHPVQLQINQSGSWRSVLNFDAKVPDEFMQAAEDLVRLSGADATMRIVICETGPNGGPVATRTQLMTWSRAKGWVKA